MTFDTSVPQDQPIPKRPFAAQIEKEMARFRARYFAWKQQRAVAKRVALGGTSPARRGGAGTAALKQG